MESLNRVRSAASSFKMQNTARRMCFGSRARCGVRRAPNSQLDWRCGSWRRFARIRRSQVPPFQVNLDGVWMRTCARISLSRFASPAHAVQLAHAPQNHQGGTRFFSTRARVREIETPMLIRVRPKARATISPRGYTPDNSALPQSPQLLKQITMIAGFGRCCRSRVACATNQRADRQPIHTGRRRDVVCDAEVCSR